VNKALIPAVVILAALLVIQTVRLYRSEKEATQLVSEQERSRTVSSEQGQLAHARLLLEEGAHSSIEDASNDPLSDYLVEAVATFLDPDNTYDSAAASSERDGKAAKGKTSDKTPEASRKRAAAKRAAVEARRADAKNAKGLDANGEAPAYDPKRSKQLYNQARKLIQMGSYDAAAAALEESLVANASNASSYRTLGALYRQLGMTAEEMEVYADWSAARPEDPLAHYYLANAYLRMGADPDVLSELDQFQELSADNLAAYAMAASVYRRMGMPDAEGVVLEAWVDQVPQSFDARQALAQHYQRSGQYEAALAEYQAAVTLIPDNVQAHANLGSAYARVGLYSEAQTEYATAISLRPNDAGLHYQLAEMYRRANDLPNALASYQSVISIQPESPQAQRAARMMTRIERQLNTGGKVLG
jgi:tetratricopeptide (TPR) repeat protein